ncbi:MAG: H-type lectin domain-containing protein [Paracoccaceae bacterium]
MKRLRNHLIGIDQGDLSLFSDFQNGGEMWTGRGQRERARAVVFSEKFRHAPVVHVTLSMWDMDNKTVSRAEVSAENITSSGCNIVFRTWGDTRVARARASWIAFGELDHSDDWILSDPS